MRGHCLQVPCSGFFLLLLLPQSILHSHSEWSYFYSEPMDPDTSQDSDVPEGRSQAHEHKIERDFTFEPEEVLPQVIEYCDGIFDVYYLLAKSKTTTNWRAIFISLEDFVEKHVDPNQRMSFILFDTYAKVVMERTGNRDKIRAKLTEIKNVLLVGEHSLNLALKKANEQIIKVNSKGIKVFNIIMVMLTGVMKPEVLEDAKKEADKARLLGSYVFIIGLNKASRRQLLMIADDEDHVFYIGRDPDLLHEEVDKIATMACPMVKFAEPLCIGDKEVVVKGYGFHNGKNRDRLTCRLTIGDKTFEEEAVNRTKNSISCPVPKLDSPERIVKIEISLNNGTIYLVRPVNADSTGCNLTSLTTTTSQPLTTVTVATTTPIQTTTPTTTPTTTTTTTTTTTPSPLLQPVVPILTPPEETETTETTKTTLPPETTTTPTPETVPPPEPIPPPEIPIFPPLPIAPPQIPGVPQSTTEFHFGPTDMELFITIVLGMMLIPVLLWWVWWLCCRKVKQPPPPVKIKKKKHPPPPPPTVNVCPTVIVCCCSCRGICVNRCLPGNRTMYGLQPPLCQPLPLMWYPSRIQGSSSNFSLLPAICGQMPCNSQRCLPSSQECVPVTYCPRCHNVPGQCSWPPSRVLSLISQSDWRAHRPPLSLPPM